MNISIGIIQQAINDAENRKSSLSSNILNLDGMSSPKVRHFLNNICHISENINYLEIGVWKGSTFTSALYNNAKHISHAYAIDNWSQFNGSKELLINSLKELKDVWPQHTIIESDSFSVDLSLFKEKIDIYFYDGDHSRQAQKKALEYYLPILKDEFIYIVDDWNHSDVSSGTREGINSINYSIEKEWILPANGNGDTENWWNGFYVALLKRKPKINIQDLEIICITKSFPDYLHEAIYLGLSQLGCNIIDHPRKCNLHGERHPRTYNPGQLLFNLPKNSHNKETDLLLVLFDIENAPFEQYDAFLKISKKQANPKKFVLLDGLDSKNNPYPLVNEFDAIFVRELYEQKKPNIFPINFCAIPEYFQFVPFKNRTYDLSFVATSISNPRRKITAEFIKKISKKLGLKSFVHVDKNPINRKDYLEVLHNSKTSISMTGAGQDCYRYWEIPAHGSVLISEKLNIIIEDNYTPEHCFNFDTEESLEKILVDVKNIPSDKLEIMALNSMEHTNKFHTPQCRALYILKKIFGETLNENTYIR